MLIFLYSLHPFSILYFRLEGFFAFLRVQMSLDSSV